MTLFLHEEVSTKLVELGPFVLVGGTTPPRDPEDDEDEDKEDDDEEGDEPVVREPDDG
jgi:hypothetical protein